MLPDELFLAEHGRPAINYLLIAQAINFYKACGFEYIEVPWAVPEVYNKITYPGPFPFNTEYGVLVGSAEQSLLYMASLGKLKFDHRYVTASPCFRDDAVDAIHQKSFFKVELFVLGTRCANELMQRAMDFYIQIGLKTDIVKVSEDQNDLCCKNIELGSYGERASSNLLWSYGTGIAEPRTSFVLNQR